MGPLGYPMTRQDLVRIEVLAGTAWHLDVLAKTGLWTARADRTHDMLGRLGLGRN